MNQEDGITEDLARKIEDSPNRTVEIVPYLPSESKRRSTRKNATDVTSLNRVQWFRKGEQ